MTPPPERPIAVDAMGGDHAPDEIVAGAREAAERLGLSVLLVGRREDIDRAGGAGPCDVLEASEVIAMDADPAQSVRRLKDSSMVRAAEAVRLGSASAMVSAGNTGAAMASALLRMGRIRGVARPAIATPIPEPGGHVTVLIDSGANADCSPEWLVQFAQMGAVFVEERYGRPKPRIGLLSIGEEPSKGNEQVKTAHKLLRTCADEGLLPGDFVGNVEGRDLMSPVVDVVVCDGFTGNVALKTLEGGMRAMVRGITEAFGATDETRKAAEVLLPALAPMVERLDPDNTGGAVLLGVKGVCVIAHGSSKRKAVVNAIKVAAEMVRAGMVERLEAAVSRLAPGGAREEQAADGAR
ncbi:MAG: phosphate acyltransferase [Acidimicrobiales bacterium]|nr:MAG: phosphate acyltransferase [Acidimicrobiales bacterium]